MAERGKFLAPEAQKLGFLKYLNDTGRFDDMDKRGLPKKESVVDTSVLEGPPAVRTKSIKSGLPSPKTNPNILAFMKKLAQAGKFAEDGYDPKKVVPPVKVPTSFSIGNIGYPLFEPYRNNSGKEDLIIKIIDIDKNNSYKNIDIEKKRFY